MRLCHPSTSQYNTVVPKPPLQPYTTVNAGMVSKIIANNTTVCWSTMEEIVKWDIKACSFLRVIDSNKLLENASTECVQENPLALAEVSDHIISTHCSRECIFYVGALVWIKAFELKGTRSYCKCIWYCFMRRAINPPRATVGLNWCAFRPVPARCSYSLTSVDISLSISLHIPS